MIEQVAQPLRLVHRPPGEGHPGEERDGMHPGNRHRIHLAGQRARLGPGVMLGAAGRQDPLGQREQPVARRGRRVRLEQRKPGPGQGAGRTPGWVDIAGAQVHDREVRQRPVGAPQWPDDQHRLGNLVQRAEDGKRRGGRADRPVGQPQGEYVGEPGEHGRHRGPGADVEYAPGGRPPGFGHADQNAGPVPQGQHGPGGSPPPRCGGGHPVARRQTAGAPQVRPGGGDPLLGAVELRRQPPPAAGLGATEPVGTEQVERAVRVE
jgi:hypothetical protein